VDNFPKEDSTCLRNGLPFLLEMCSHLSELAEKNSASGATLRSSVDVVLAQIARFTASDFEHEEVILKLHH